MSIASMAARAGLRSRLCMRSLSTTAPACAPSTSSTKASSKKTPKPRRQISFIERSGSSIFKAFLPITPSLRHLRLPVSEHLHKGDPIRKLTIAKRGTGGRNNHGRITVRARGGGHKRRIRLVDFVRHAEGEQEVDRIEYDPGRSAHIALLKHKQSGDLSYILAPEGLRAGDTVQSFRTGIPDSFKSASGPTLEAVTAPEAPQTVNPPSLLPGAPPPPVEPVARPAPSKSPASTSQIDLGMLRTVAVRTGNCLPLHLIPVGTVIHAITLSPTGPAVLARSAGSSARLISTSSSGGKHAQVRLSSGEVRLVGLECFASIGAVSNPDHMHANLGKAGRMRWLGFRPQSRGVAMNARDHPHGGGRGKSKGNNHPTDPWGNSAKGGRTRRPNSKNGNKMVVKERRLAKART